MFGDTNEFIELQIKIVHAQGLKKCKIPGKLIKISRGSP